MGVLSGLLGKGKKPLSAEEIESMKKIATAQGSVYMPALTCPQCQQRSIFTEPVMQKIGRDSIYNFVGAVRQQRFVCFNPRQGKKGCPICYTKNKTRLVMTPLGDLEGSHPFSHVFKNNPFHIDGL